MKKSRIGIRVLLAAAAVVTAVCGGTVNASADKNTKSGTMIGVSLAGTSGETGGLTRKILDHAARALGVEIRYVEHNNVTENIVGSFEILAESGCAAMILSCEDEEALLYATEACEQYKIYTAQFYGTIDEETQPDLYAAAKAAKYFIGAVDAKNEGGAEEQTELQKTAASPDDLTVEEELTNKEQYCQALYAFIWAYQAAAAKDADYSDSFERLTMVNPSVATEDALSRYQSKYVDSLPYSEEQIRDLAKRSKKKLRAAAEKLSK
ncbi:MAG: hypothetical protein Q4B09_08255 [Lachnospiraceae bacterium]|nr:hypothetical protein [Lachnospiraceae bacterium]